ncbi:MAG: hypothetical protein AABO57_20805 [Acidobacteriota bacterium]
MTSAIGLGATVFFFLMGLSQKNALFLTGLGVTAFLIGLGLIVNALLFTVPKQYVPQHSPHQRDLLDQGSDSVITVKRELSTADPLNPPQSVTEQTTHHLTDSPAGAC